MGRCSLTTRYQKHATRTRSYAVRVIVTATWSVTADVTAQSSSEAEELAVAATKELLNDLDKPSWAESYETQVEAVDIAAMESLIDESAAD